MSTAAKALFEQALSLSDEERLDLFHRLEESLYPAPPAAEDQSIELTDEEKATLDRRWEEITSGKVKCIRHEEVINKLRSRHAV